MQKMESFLFTQPEDDVVALAWNKQVEHILASAHPNLGRTVIWDLRKSEPIIQVTDISNRVCTMYSVLYAVCCSKLSERSLCNVRYMIYVQCALYDICTLYIVHYTLYIH